MAFEEEKPKVGRWYFGRLLSHTEKPMHAKKRIQFCCVLYLFRQIAGCNQQYTQSGDCNVMVAARMLCNKIHTKIQKSQGLILLLSSLLFCAF